MPTHTQLKILKAKNAATLEEMFNKWADLNASLQITEVLPLAVTGTLYLFVFYNLPR